MKNLFYIFLSLVLISCAAEEELVPSTPATPTSNGLVTDCDGNEYETVLIGNQEWMAENLRTACYQNGDPIPNEQGSVQWDGEDGVSTGAWCHYNNDSQYEIPYGKIYNWYAVDDPRNLCPLGWHVPTDAEWSVMIGFLDPQHDPNVIDEQSTIAGGKMKSVGTVHWESPNAGATNESGFSALPGGARGADLTNDQFNNTLGFLGGWWASDTAWWSHQPFLRLIEYDDGDIERAYGLKRSGLSVRCIKD
jgi:uncharacterized protein (TIGR02145 family)